MALLWKNAAAHQVEAMAWHDGDGLNAEKAGAMPVKKAGFAGYVGGGYDLDEDYGHHEGHEPDFDDDLWDETTPEPTHEEQAHYDEHEEYPDSHMERHDHAYNQALQARKHESDPDHEDEELHTFVAHHGDDTALWQSKATLGPVSLKQPVYATQSHVGKVHLDRYRDNPQSPSYHVLQRGPRPDWAGSYLGDEHPMFVTHEGRLHCTEGHHRVGAALMDGHEAIHGWHYDADKHGLPGNPEDEDWD